LQKTHPKNKGIVDSYKKITEKGFPIALLLGVAVSAAALVAIFSADNLDVAVFGMYTFLIMAVVAALGMPLVNVIDNPKSLLRIGIGIGVTLLIFGISYAVASDSNVQADNASPAQVKLAGALLTTMWIFLALAAVAILVSEIVRVVRK
jgi:hypothetical protein